MDLTAILTSQYLASLEMLKQAIIQCPEEVWNAEGDRNRFWQVAFHALYFTHEYLADSYDSFIPWSGHRAGYEDFPPPAGGEPYDKESILEYLAFCQQHVRERLPLLKLDGMEGHGRSYTTMELMIYSIRHIMQHAGELMERLSARSDADIEWVGSVRG